MGTMMGVLLAMNLVSRFFGPRRITTVACRTQVATSFRREVAGRFETRPLPQPTFRGIRERQLESPPSCPQLEPEPWLIDPSPCPVPEPKDAPGKQGQRDLQVSQDIPGDPKP
eukprot:s5636_g1.t1